mmetsp:Transcript_3037/g.10147  ORF Transcript_3037/g.10147 Transcript_3037/m.10147 type:complete len:210 (+) Transcript_3037:140-769(+)|eukprot:CAMPEP_0196669998 /NCGR_PEP_ID=MMETSP1090-20130531/975_1 /TAXON_ID=37098 /ORGANISM="Isochrysis sp, Strain CCMP1244" /LENGTH=209 /DNA_ID=CAMNT_0042007581 /DNA_START=118 /DNA_END=747 /DNA_ORIENTATION=+
MGIGDLFRAAGLSLADTSFLKLNALFPLMLGGAHMAVVSWVKCPASVVVVEALPVSADKVPMLVVASMPILATMLSVVALECLAAMAPKGYESQRGRAQKAPGAASWASCPAWVERIQWAQYNTWEALMCLLPSLYVAKECALPSPLLAKLCALFLLLRLVYPFAYALDIDLVRTQLWLTGFYATGFISFAALYPEIALPLVDMAAKAK